jgi:hypothetical protein
MWGQSAARYARQNLLNEKTGVLRNGIGLKAQNIGRYVTNLLRREHEKRHDGMHLAVSQKLRAAAIMPGLLARPGGNITGFTSFEYSIAGKWFELLKAIAPRLTRMAVLRDPAYPAGIGQLAVIQSAASSAVELSVIDPRDAEGLERAIDTFAREPSGGLIVTGSTSAAVHHELINSLAMRRGLPVIHAYRYGALSGGSYGPNTIDDLPLHQRGGRAAVTLLDHCVP